MYKIQTLQELIDQSEHIVFFGGAGVSTESGIKDFRSKDGLYRLHSKYGTSYEEMLSHTYFFTHTDTFYEFYREFMIPKNVQPNAAHKFLAKLENIKDFKPVFNQAEKFYRTKFEGSKLLYFIRIPNIAYEIAYTGELYENIIAQNIKEAQFIHDAIKDVEGKIEKDPLLSFDGRYIKGTKNDKILIDLWFLPQKTAMNKAEAEKIISKALKHEPVNISGNEKEGK